MTREPQSQHELSPSAARLALAIALYLSLGGAAGCFYYDSRWGEAKRIQQAQAQRESQQALRPTDPERATSAARGQTKLALRVYVTPSYATLYTDWSRRVAQIVGDANVILAPTVGRKLEIVGVSVWHPRASEDDLGALLGDLEQMDRGRDVEWVAGFAGSLPRFELSFHMLGLGQLPGKHFVLRAMNDAREYEYAQLEFSELDEETRTKLYRARAKHKTSAVFLHELAHTLGVLHEPSSTSIMHPMYNPKVVSFSRDAAQLMRVVLDERLDSASRRDPPRFAKIYTDQLRATAETWVPSELERTLQQYGARPSVSTVGPPAPPSASVAPPPPPESPELSKLSAEDRRAYEQSRDDQQAGRTDEAWNRAQPLFAKYPSVLLVQDLRCQLAMKRGMDWAQTRVECEGLMKLTPGLAPKRPAH
jgi:hypothetical protein